VQDIGEHAPLRKTRQGLRHLRPVVKKAVMIRLFAALAIPGPVAEALAERQTGLEAARWRPLDTLHITLRFFGQVPEDRADDLDLALAQVSGRAMDLVLEGAGAFGEGRDIRAIWAGVAANPGLDRLARRCEIAARRAGLKAEARAYKPHVTLAYLRRPDPAAVAAWIQANNLLRSPSFRADAFGLYSSWGTDEGSVYRLERRYGLAQALRADGSE
jgi:2'-5' RNA ligase